MDQPESSQVGNTFGCGGSRPSSITVGMLPRLSSVSSCLRLAGSSPFDVFLTFWSGPVLLSILVIAPLCCCWPALALALACIGELDLSDLRGETRPF